MRRRAFIFTSVVAASGVAVGSIDVLHAQRRGRGGPPPGRGRGQIDEHFRSDQEDFHYLLTNRDKIHREVTNLDNGVQTVTESDDAAVAKRIQVHVAAMHRRVSEGDPIHRRDPLFDALFRRADRITMEIEKTDQGVQVKETSDDPLTVRLIQAHAQVVSLFIKNGHGELRKNRAVPQRPARPKVDSAND